MLLCFSSFIIAWLLVEIITTPFEKTLAKGLSWFMMMMIHHTSLSGGGKALVFNGGVVQFKVLDGFRSSQVVFTLSLSLFPPRYEQQFPSFIILPCSVSKKVMRTHNKGTL